ncbi:MAG: nicotinate (nicotinamide) nucleotide adenylyltransferase [Hyphomonadaceae bacterium]
MRVGLFGGSFNPAHEGHLHVANTALDRLALDWVWWIVARGNPLKSDHGDFAKRLASAEMIAEHPRMRVLDIEQRDGLTYSIDTITQLQQGNKTVRFVWLMGGDNLEHFHKWKAWETIAMRVPIAVIARPGAELGDSAFERRFSSERIPEDDAANLANYPAPAWTYLTGEMNPTSSTAIRAQRDM